MTKVLVVDDEPALARVLMRTILHRRPDFAVLTANGGAEAINMLEEQHFDLVITDLRMSDMDGFQLLAWLVSQRPDVLALAMTGYADDVAEQRLHAIGAIECFHKPLDVDALITCINDRLARHVRGEVHNVGLASFLQLLELEKKTCVLEVRSMARFGKLHLRSGELIDASTGALSGEEAACAIIGWPQVSIAIEGRCNVATRTITRSVSYLVMEAMRLSDEGARSSSRSSSIRAPTEDTLSSWGPTFTSALPPTMAPQAHSRATLGAFRLPVGALMLAVVDGDTGALLLGLEDGAQGAAELAQSAWHMLRHERRALAHEVEEIAMLTTSRGELIKPIPTLNSFAFLLFDAEKTNLVMARLELDSFLLEYVAASRTRLDACG